MAEMEKCENSLICCTIENFTTILLSFNHEQDYNQKAAMLYRFTQTISIQTFKETLPLNTFEFYQSFNVKTLRKELLDLFFT
jgi:hypothetical protein